MPPLPVSIIVPTKNEGASLDGCLRSLANQRTKIPYEILVVDTNSTDETLGIAGRWGARIIAESRPGKSRARQTGGEQAAGEILCFTEADCQVPDTWVETIVNTFKAEPATVAVTGGYTLMDSSWWYSLLTRLFHPLSVYAFYVIYRHHSLRGTNFAVRAEAFRQLGGFNTQTKELDDVEFSMRAKKLGKIRYVPATNVQTLDRRFKNRFLTFLTEFAVSFYRVCIRRQPVTRSVYEDIR